MKIQTIGESSIAVYMDLAELNSRGIEPDKLNSSSTISLARQAFTDLGVKADGAIDVDAYINGQGVMVFASLRSPACDVSTLYRFENLEDMIGAAHSLDATLISTLIYYDQAYYLAFHACQKDAKLDVLSEFGQAEEKPELRYLYLSERGKVLSYGNAVATIQEAFHVSHHN